MPNQFLTGVKLILELIILSQLLLLQIDCQVGGAIHHEGQLVANLDLLGNFGVQLR